MPTRKQTVNFSILKDENKCYPKHKLNLTTELKVHVRADNTVNVLWFDCIIGLIKMTFLSNYKNVLKGGKCQRP